MAGPWDKYQSTQGPWAKYQQPQQEQSADTSSQEKPTTGFWGNLGSDLKAMITPGETARTLDRSNMGPLFGPKDVHRQEAQQAEVDNARQENVFLNQHGYSQAYKTGSGLAQSLMGINAQGMERSAVIGDTAGVYGHAAAPVAAIGTAELAGRGVPFLSSKVSGFARAEGNPNKIYASYLKPVANAPMPVPEVPAPVMRAVIRDMRAAGETAAAERITGGKATVGDLDMMRQRANRLASTIYKSPGNYTPGLAEGADNLANAIREKTYPFIERANGLPPGSLSGVKKLQGAAMQAQRNPTLPNRLITKGGGAIGGGAVGFATGGPIGAGIGGVVGQYLAEPMATALDRAVIGARTRAMAMDLPPAGLVERPALPPARIMPEAPIPSGPTNAPAYSNTTRAQRLGLLLPESTGGPFELPYNPQMTPGEFLSSVTTEMRRPAPKALPAKASAIQLGPSGELLMDGKPLTAAQKMELLRALGAKK